MAKPLVAIVGRPNVGKSTFFNKMAGRRVAIVEDTPGVTRDRVYADCEWQNYRFTMIDTGGIDPTSDDPLLQQMRRQAEIAIETCDVILFFVDGTAGTHRRRSKPSPICSAAAGKPVMLVVNKIDNVGMDERTSTISISSGMGDPIGVSSRSTCSTSATCSRSCASTSPSRTRRRNPTAPVQIAVAGQPQRRQILAGQPDAGRGARHGQRHRRYDARRHRHPLHRRDRRGVHPHRYRRHPQAQVDRISVARALFHRAVAGRHRPMRRGAAAHRRARRA